MLAMPGAEVKPSSGTTPSMDMANCTLEENTHRLYAGSFLNQMFLIVVDMHSKWPEVIQM